MPRTLDDLLSADSTWPALLDLFARSPHDVRVTAAHEESREAALLATQVTTHSMLGTIAWNCGVVAIDHGWVRLVGAGPGGIAGVRPEHFEDVVSDQRFDGIVVAYDVLGGRFAIHGGGLDHVAAGEVLYWAPDSLSWQPTGRGHSALVEFLLSERLSDFYADLRWTGWQEETARVPLDHGLSAYPPPWSSEGRGDTVSRRAVAMQELVAHAEDTARQLVGRADGESTTMQTS